MNTNNTNITNVRVQEGSDVTIDGVGTIRVTVISNDGNGATERREAPVGATVRSMVNPGPRDVVRVNGQAAQLDQTLQNGDKVSVTPGNVAGA